MRKSLLLLVTYILVLFLVSCSKDKDISCDCEVITIEQTNYRVSGCAPDIFFDGRATPKQARIREAQDNCQ